MKHYLAVMGLATALPLAGQTARPAEKQARETIAAMRVQGRVGGSLDTRVRRTERSYNYRLRATWVTPAVFETAGRILEIAKGLPESEAARVLSEARSTPGHYILVELDPREGSGVIPKDWLARFGPAGVDYRQAVGQVVPDQGAWRTLLGAFPRDYAYDLFVVRSALETAGGIKLLERPDDAPELVVRVYEKAGRVRWNPQGAQGR